MDYVIAYLVAGERRSVVIDAPDAATAAVAVMATRGDDRFELLSVRPVEATEPRQEPAAGTPTDGP